MTGKLLFQGGCHCELVKFEFRSLKKVEVWTCNCSICSLNDYQHLFVRHSDFNLISGKEYLTSYRFATQTAEHLFCRRCGVKSFYQPRSRLSLIFLLRFSFLYHSLLSFLSPRFVFRRAPLRATAVWAFFSLEGFSIRSPQFHGRCYDKI